MNTRRLNYLSYDSQIAFLVNLQAKIAIFLTNNDGIMQAPHKQIHLKTIENEVKKPIIQVNLMHNDLIDALIYEMDKMIDEFEICAQNKLFATDNIMLTKYVDYFKRDILGAGQRVIMNMYNRTFQSAEQKAIIRSMRVSIANAVSYCKEQEAYLENAVDIKIYKVTMPMREFKHLRKKNQFQFKARSKNGNGDVKVGLTCKQDFPTEWIEGYIDRGSTLEKIKLKENKNFTPINQGQSKTVYMLEGRNPDYLFRFGTDYRFVARNVSRDHGHLIFFELVEDAIECAFQRHEGSLYDSIGGWRKNTPWELKDLRVITFEVTKLIRADAHMHKPFFDTSKRRKESNDSEFKEQAECAKHFSRSR